MPNFKAQFEGSPLLTPLDISESSAFYGQRPRIPPWDGRWPNLCRAASEAQESLRHIWLANNWHHPYAPF
jgi:hypothetical protein